MTVNVTDNTYVAKIWFIAWDGSDWMATLYKEVLDAKWTLSYRFRYYKPDPLQDPFTDDDEKSGYTATMTGTEAEMIAACDDIARMMVDARGGVLDEVVIGEVGSKALTTALSGRPWAHMRQLQ